jgi:hypothetical protein
VGNQSLLVKKEKKAKKVGGKKKPKKETNIITINQEITSEIEKTYFLDSESE